MDDIPELIKRAKLTQLAVLINVIVFLLEEASGGSGSTNALVRAGAMYTPAVMDGLEYRRMLSSIFIHFGAEHLFGNMAALLAAGAFIEVLMGKGWFAAIFLISGLAGNGATAAAEMLTGDYMISAGASGAVSGLIGAYMVLMATKRISVNIPRGNLIMAAVCILLPGITDGGINFWAHAGGLAAGAAAAMIYTTVNRRSGCGSSSGNDICNS
ncbi:MAG: rhomboid family intramembrane serine protease [Clostridiales bacterium]|nr:rhomboid family intramembrane serine protease [Clostridiales bacterium]